jgi:hypothetical protein
MKPQARLKGMSEQKGAGKKKNGRRKQRKEGTKRKKEKEEGGDRNKGQRLLSLSACLLQQSGWAGAP